MQDTVQSRVYTQISCVLPDTSLQAALNQLLIDRQEGLFLQTRQNTFAGYLPAYSLLKAVLHRESLQSPVVSLASANVTTIEAEAPMYEVAPLFREARFDHLVVLEGRRLLGILRRIDVLQWLAERHAEYPQESGEPLQRSEIIAAPRFLTSYKNAIVEKWDRHPS